MQAAIWYRKAADLGDRLAEYSIARMCERRRGVPRDVAQAVGWYKRLAEVDAHVDSAADPFSLGTRWAREAEQALARIYDRGDGIPRDATQALYGYRKLAEHGGLDQLEATRAISRLESDKPPSQ